MDNLSLQNFFILMPILFTFDLYQIYVILFEIVSDDESKPLPKAQKLNRDYQNIFKYYF